MVRLMEIHRQHGALGGLIWSVCQGFHPRSVDPHRGLLQIKKVIFHDYRVNFAICGPTRCVKPQSSIVSCAPSSADPPGFG
jgi:hypothetical protein